MKLIDVKGEIESVSNIKVPKDGFGDERSTGQESLERERARERNNRMSV